MVIDELGEVIDGGGGGGKELAGESRGSTELPYEVHLRACAYKRTAVQSNIYTHVYNLRIFFKILLFKN